MRLQFFYLLIRQKNPHHSMYFRNVESLKVDILVYATDTFKYILEHFFHSLIEIIENEPNKLFINTIINSTPIKPMPLINTSCT